ncbi:MAG: N-acetyltransferase [Rhodospirillales bacterium]|nr:N-acetyltransferase [Rhodospirillales bacterium]MBO6786906.1 N-acetyltransferase [Rhodospirillales bacterium]
MLIRDEIAGDAAAISAVVENAFAGTVYSDGTEPAIVAGLRDAGAMTLSLVADVDGEVAGHIAFSPVTVAGAAGDWLGLGPLAVDPARQRQGIGTALVEAGLVRLRTRGHGGCVVFGDPAYYRRFGFAPARSMTLKGAPAGYFMILPFGTAIPAGEVRFHDAFGVASGD